MRSSTLPTTLSAIIDGVDSKANANSAFTAIKGTSYSKISTTLAQDLLDSHTSLDDVIVASALSSTAKASLSDFADTFLQLCQTQDDYGVVYDYIVDYEGDVASLFTGSDKKQILTITSIVRHSQFKRKKPKNYRDLDWEHNVFHLVGAIEGSSNGTAEAITTALSLGIYEGQ
jgi:hypothetical protein